MDVTRKITEDLWRLQEDITAMKAGQIKLTRVVQQHSERLTNVENHRRIESRPQPVWNSYFPSVHNAAPFPQLAQPFPTMEPSLGPFTPFDTQPTPNIISGLPLDEVDVPRRGASRANSVRFDESAIQNHWVPSSHSSSEYMTQRSSSAIGGHPLLERSLSYKSDGRQSSMRSFDNFSMAGSEHESSLPSALRPRDIMECNTPSRYDTSPATIKCWLGPDCSSDSVLYAVLNSGYQESMIDMDLVSRFGFKDQVRKEDNDEKIELSLFLGGSVLLGDRPVTSCSLPRLRIEFTVIHTHSRSYNPKLVQILLGSDILSAISADIMFSKRHMLFEVKNGQKVMVDFVREPLNLDIFTIPKGLPSAMKHKIPNGKPSVISNSAENGTPTLDQSLPSLHIACTSASSSTANQSLSTNLPHKLSADATPFFYGKGSLDPGKSIGLSSGTFDARVEHNGKSGDLPSAVDVDGLDNSDVSPTTNAPTADSAMPTPMPTPVQAPAEDYESATTPTNLSNATPTSKPSTNVEAPPTPTVVLNLPNQEKVAAATSTDTPTIKPYAAVASKGVVVKPTLKSNMNSLWRKSEVSGVLGSGTASSSGMGFAKVASTNDNGTTTPKPMRTMKVLRPSSSKNASPAQTAPPSEVIKPEPAKPTDATSTNGFKPGSKLSRSTSVSGESINPPTKTKSRSSTNVVGGATAFKWMSGPMAAAAAAAAAAANQQVPNGEKQ